MILKNLAKNKLAIWLINLTTILIFYETNSKVNFLKNKKENIKILVLIIASDDLPVYGKLQKLWRSYMHIDYKHVEAYFIKGDPSLATNFVIKDDIIWLKTDESLIPGILNKTLLAMEAFLPRLHQFNFLLRTNLSSFYVFPTLLQFLINCPQKNFYCGVAGCNFISGAGFLLSPDLVELLVKNKNLLMNNTFDLDDVVIGNFLVNNGIHLTPHNRITFDTINDWLSIKNHLPYDVFQFRIKTNQRLLHDPYIMSQLISLFYNKSQNK
jgi:hypothetical protein